METLRRDFDSAGDSNTIAISTGFDRHENDRGVNHATRTHAPSGFTRPIAGNARGLHYRPAGWALIRWDPIHIQTSSTAQQ